MFHARVAPAAARFARDFLRPSSTHNFAFRGRRLLSDEPPLSRIPPRGLQKLSPIRVPANAEVRPSSEDDLAEIPQSSLRPSLFTGIHDTNRHDHEDIDHQSPVARGRNVRGAERLRLSLLSLFPGGGRVVVEYPGCRDRPPRFCRPRMARDTGDA